MPDMIEDITKFISDTYASSITCQGITHSSWGQNGTTSSRHFWKLIWLFLEFLLLGLVSIYAFRNILGKNTVYFKILFFFLTIRVKTKSKVDIEIIYMWVTDSCGYQLDKSLHGTENKLLVS